MSLAVLQERLAEYPELHGPLETERMIELHHLLGLSEMDPWQSDDLKGLAEGTNLKAREILMPRMANDYGMYRGWVFEMSGGHKAMVVFLWCHDFKREDDSQADYAIALYAEEGVEEKSLDTLIENLVRSAILAGSSYEAMSEAS